MKARVFYSTIGGWYVKYMWDDGSYSWRRGAASWRGTYDKALAEIRQQISHQPCYCVLPQRECLPCQCSNMLRGATK